jgi:7-cyano-7-deazaguanine synthase in queuosine biosynthesis
MKDKNIFVLWSGGLDSTYLIWNLLQFGNKVTTGYISLPGNGNQAEREREAINNILPIFQKNYHDRFNYIGEPIEVTFRHSNNNWQLSYPPLFLFLPYIMTNDITEIAIGYVMNDDAISFLDEIKTIYNAMGGLTQTPLPDLTFPLIKHKKETIWYALPEEIRSYVTWCENHYGEPNKDNCPSCKRMSFIDELIKCAEVEEVIVEDDEEHF